MSGTAPNPWPRGGPSAPPAAELPRLVIENVSPCVDVGRHPVKRIVGETIEIHADIYKDGHDLLGACVRYRAPGDAVWNAVPLVYDEPHDRWSASIFLDRLGRWLYTIEAWTDAFGTWRRALQKRLDAGLDVVEVELMEGAALLEATTARAGGEAGVMLAKTAALLRDQGASLSERARAALSPEVCSVMAAHGSRAPRTRHGRVFAVAVDRERARFASWYEMFPRSQGTMPDHPAGLTEAEKRLARLAALGFDVIYLPPIHPIGRTRRRGRDNAAVALSDEPGSPWAVGNEHGGHTAVAPELGTLEDFRRFTRTARSLNMEVALDYALQFSPDHPWIREHPQWFSRRPDGSLRSAANPPHVYEDIAWPDFWCEDRAALWEACRDILLFWIKEDVRVFRVDNPHTKPFAFWEWLIADVKEVHPDVIFLAEAFTRPKPMRRLSKIGFTQSYTYFIWRNTAEELRGYLTELTGTEMVEYFRANFFANTPDVLPEALQRGGRPAFRVRLLLAGTLSPVYGIYSGFELCENEPLRPGSEEYLHSEKYEIRVRDWDAPEGIQADVATLNRIRRENRALQLYSNLTFHPSSDEDILFYRKTAPGNDLLIAVNLDPHRAHEAFVQVPIEAMGIAPEEPFVVEDLLTGEAYTWRGARNYVRLDPQERVGHVLKVVRAAREGR
jgi:starch synthase (maltosyl-transferring)